MPDYTYTFPGSRQRKESVERLREIGLSAEGVTRVMQETLSADQALWERAVDTEYTDPLQIRLRDAIWHSMFDYPFFDHCDTMEVASMRVKVFDVLDAIWPIISVLPTCAVPDWSDSIADMQSTNQPQQGEPK